MTLPTITEGLIREHATAQSFERGQQYRREGAVLDLVMRETHLIANVAGGQYEPYRVEIMFDQVGITHAYCSCPYDWGGWCKHIVAVLLTLIKAPESVEERPSLEAIVADLDREQLQSLLLQIAEGDARLINQIERYVEGWRVQPTSSEVDDSVQERRPLVDPEPFRRRVHHILHSLDRMRASEAYWHVGSVVNEVGEVLEDVWDFIRAGDGQNAIRILEAITEEYVNQWYYLDDSDGYAGEFFESLSQAWTEAVLMVELTEVERESWLDRLEAWQSEVDNYGIYAFDAAIAALRQGWDYEPLQQVLQGEITSLGAWGDENVPWYADQLTEARLNVLECQERYDAYLNLAEAEGQTARYVTMLVRLDRVQEAMDYGLRYLSMTGEAWALAQALRAHDNVEEALRIAQHGLTLQGHKAQLASWLRDTADGAGHKDLALEAAVVAFRASPNLNAYQRARELAGSTWAGLRGDLLSFLRERSGAGHASEVVDVFLHEDLVDDAIAALGRWPSYDTLAQVVEAATECRSDWAIRTSREQAEQIMDAGKSQAYHHAVEWLSRAKAAYQAAGRGEAWQTYLNQLLEKHSRKYKLVPMLKTLR